MEVTDQHFELRKLVKSVLYPWRKLTIGIDGRDGVGKSGLARYLAWEFDLPAIDTDMLIINDAGPRAYRLNDLGRLIDARHRLDRPIIVEGVFLLETLGKLGVTCDFLVYVEDQDASSTEYLAPMLTEYGAAFDPKEKADFVFVWRTNR